MIIQNTDYMNVLHNLEHTLRSVGSLTREAFVTHIPRIRDVIWRVFLSVRSAAEGLSGEAEVG
jgi:hypothetical protein